MYVPAKYISVMVLLCRVQNKFSSICAQLVFFPVEARGYCAGHHLQDLYHRLPQPYLQVTPQPLLALFHFLCLLLWELGIGMVTRCDASSTCIKIYTSDYDILSSKQNMIYLQ